MHSSLIAWIMRAIPFGTIIMYGALGETHYKRHAYKIYSKIKHSQW